MTKQGGTAAALGAGCLVLIAVPVLFVVGFIVVVNVQSNTPEDYPTVAPDTMAKRVHGRAQQAYEVLGFDRAPGRDARMDSSYCYPDGLESINDKPQQGAYSLSYEWALDKVPEDQAVAALRRVERKLEKDGWKVESSHSGGFRDLYARRGTGDAEERQSFHWKASGGGRFDGGSSGPCAYDRDAPESDAYAKPQVDGPLPGMTPGPAMP
ncbi:hypothetical protein G5C51_09580 [Streptomyces sp. A7024]|uniref:Uncharacterized protein n=1 Tax=Streptomyces coryli TaxID=1128680 RepID=A0A6G4TWG1_9ACTN|nr:hypothetical protein [Streptomyces coryli]NGN64153.1 hypothetical protein [Streptomyces coryli]